VAYIVVIVIFKGFFTGRVFAGDFKETLVMIDLRAERRCGRGGAFGECRSGEYDNGAKE
jgi:hypothetical protein